MSSVGRSGQSSRIRLLTALEVQARLHQCPLIEVASLRRRERLVIPGAFRLDPCQLEGVERYYPHYNKPEDARLQPLPQLRKTLAQCGLQAHRPVILYGAGWAFPMGVARVAWALLAAGMRDIAWLDGGLPAWLEAGLPLGPQRQPETVVDFGQLPDNWEEFIVTAPAGDSLLVDLRAHSEFCGERVDRYPFFRSRGHIPGALWGRNWTHLLEPGGHRLKSLETIRRDWESLGIGPDRPVVFYCGTGWRSSLACSVAHLLNFSDVRNYDGGIYDWVSRGGVTVVPSTGAQMRPPKPL